MGNKKVLTLRRETFRHLSTQEMQRQEGGATPSSALSSFISGVVASHYLEKALDAFDEWVTQITDNCPPLTVTCPPPPPIAPPPYAPSPIIGIVNLFNKYIAF